MKLTLCFFLFFTLLCLCHAEVSYTCSAPSQIALNPAFGEQSNLNELVSSPGQLYMFGENAQGQFVEFYTIDSSKFSYTNTLAFETFGFNNIQVSSMGLNVLNQQLIVALENSSMVPSPVYINQIDTTNITAPDYSIVFKDPNPIEPTYDDTGALLNETITVGSLIIPNTAAAKLDLALADGTLIVYGFIMSSEGSGKISAYNGTYWTFKTLVWPVVEAPPNSSDYVGFYRVHASTGTSVLSVHLGSSLRQTVIESQLNFSIGASAEAYMNGIEVLLFFDANGNFVEFATICVDCTVSSLSFKTRNANNVDAVMATGTSYANGMQNAFYYNYVSLFTPTAIFTYSFELLNTAGLSVNSVGFDIVQSSANCGSDDCDIITGVAADGTIFVLLYNPFSLNPVVQLSYFTEIYDTNFTLKRVNIATYPDASSTYGLVTLALSSADMNNATNLQLSVYWNARLNSNSNCVTTIQWWVILIISIGSVIVFVFLIWSFMACCRHVKVQRERDQYFAKHAGPAVF